MREGWKSVQIEDVAKVVNGGTPKTKVAGYWGGEHLWITPAEMGRIESPYLTDSRRKLSDAGLQHSSATLVPSHSVVLSTRAPIGHLIINSVPMAFNQGCRGIVPGEKIYYKYVYYFLSFSVDLLNDLGAGTTFKELTAGKLKKVAVPLPPLPEQKRIVAILDEAFAGIATAIANTERNLANARELFESYLNEVFSQRDQGWSNRYFGDVAEFKNGLNFTKSSKGETVRIVGVKDFKSNYFVPVNELAEVQIEGSLKSAFELRPNDIVIVRSNGNKQLIGRSLLVKELAAKTSHSGFTIRARLKAKGLSPEFLVYYLKSSRIREQLVASGDGTNISSLNQRALASLIVAFPSDEGQSAIIGRVNEIDADTRGLEAIYQRKLTALSELKQSLLQKAFSGELTGGKEAPHANLKEEEVA